MIPVEDLENLGPKRAFMLDAILRKISPDSNTVVDSWSSSSQIVSGPPGFDIGIIRQHDGCWRFGPETVANIPIMFAKLTSEEQAKYNYTHDLANPRNTIFFFLAAVNTFNNREAIDEINEVSKPPDKITPTGTSLIKRLRVASIKLSLIKLKSRACTAFL